jgi:arylsulfatase A
MDTIRQYIMNPKKYIRAIPWMALLLFVTSCNHQPEKPNVLLILADDVGREMFSSYGGTSYHTPHINHLASESMRFDHVYAAPVCHPARITLMTGRYPFRFGQPAWGSFPAQAEGQTFAHEFKKAGYATAVAGKWQLCMMKDEPDHPHRLGFDEYCFFGWHEGPRYHHPLIWQNGEIRQDVAGSYGPDVYSDFLIDFMKRNRHKPFLAYYPMALIHDVSDDFEPPPPYGPAGRYENVKEMLAEMDRIVGKMMQALDDLGLASSTLVIYTTDNGTNHRSIIRHEDGEFIRELVYSTIDGMEIPGGKTQINDWGIRVPTFMRWPGKIKKGSLCKELIDFSDFLPTFDELLDLQPAPYEADGQSFAGILTGKEYETRDWVYSEHTSDRYVVRSKDWKLLPDGRLFDMKSDPLEKHPVMPAEDTPSTAAARAVLDSVMTSLRGGE